MKGTILLTGFEPFGGDDYNPSGEVARVLDGVEIGGYRIVSRVLPVEWGVAGERVRALIDETDPAVVMSLGLAAGRTELSIEKVAINYCGTSADNAGKVPAERAIVSGAPDGYFATVPVEAIVDHLNNSGIPARLSLSAGSYLCNYVFYTASHHVREKGKKALVGFIHVPAITNMACKSKRPVPSMELETIRKGVEAALDVCIKSLTNCG